MPPKVVVSNYKFFSPPHKVATKRPPAATSARPRWLPASSAAATTDRRSHRWGRRRRTGTRWFATGDPTCGRARAGWSSWGWGPVAARRNRRGDPIGWDGGLASGMGLPIMFLFLVFGFGGLCRKRGLGKGPRFIETGE